MAVNKKLRDKFANIAKSRIDQAVGFASEHPPGGEFAVLAESLRELATEAMVEGYTQGYEAARTRYEKEAAPAPARKKKASPPKKSKKKSKSKK